VGSIVPNSSSLKTLATSPKQTISTFYDLTKFRKFRTKQNKIPNSSVGT
jgi:hypothetical protein